MIRSTEIPTEQQVPRRMHCLDVRRQLPTVWTAIAFQLQVVGRFCPSLKKNVLENIKQLLLEINDGWAKAAGWNGKMN